MLQVRVLFEHWNRPNELDNLPPLKYFRGVDVTKDSENLFYKAQGVMDAILKYAKERGAITPRLDLKEVSLDKLKEICTTGLEGLITAHNEWLKKKADAAKEDFVAFISRKLLTLSFVTCYKYVHNK